MARKIASLVLLFAAFYMGGHYWIRWKNRITDDTTKSTRLVECDPNQIAKMTITQSLQGEKTELSFERVDARAEGLNSSAQLAASDWRFVGKGEADLLVVSRMASMLCELYDPIPMRAQEAALAADSRHAQNLVFELSDKGETKSLEIRFIAPTQDRMMLVEYQGKFYKILPELFRLSSQETKHYLNYRVVRMSPDTIHAASFIVDGKERFTLEREGAEWRILAAGKVMGRGSEEAGRFVNRISTLRALEIAASDFSRESCEKEKHKVRVELSGLANKKETVYFSGAKSKQDKISACSTGRLARFMVHQDLMKYLNQPVNKLIATR
jgi:hypothetical protein